MCLKTDKLEPFARQGLEVRLAGAYASLTTDTASTAKYIIDMIELHRGMFTHIEQVSERLGVAVRKPTDMEIHDLWIRIVRDFEEAEQLRQDAWELTLAIAKSAGKALPEKPSKRKMISKQFFEALVVEIWTNLVPST